METRKIELPIISSTISKKEIIPKERQKRVVTVLQNWTFSQCQLSFEKQKEYIKQIYENNICEENKRICKIILKAFGLLNAYYSFIKGAIPSGF